MRRRAFLSVLCGAVSWPLAAAAQQSTNSKRLAIFSPSEPSADLHEHSKTKAWRALFAELRRLGQIEGQNLKVERYGREQNTSGPEALATEVVRSNPDVIFVIGPDAAIFKKLTSRMPIVVITGDPVKQGLAESLAHPGGNFTGASVDTGPSIHVNTASSCPYPPIFSEIQPAVRRIVSRDRRCEKAAVKFNIDERRKPDSPAQRPSLWDRSVMLCETHPCLLWSIFAVPWSWPGRFR
jgi:ABC transporter substrate binding protein